MSKEAIPHLCPGCDAELAEPEAGHIEPGTIEVGVITRTPYCEDRIASAYCEICTTKIKKMDLYALSNDLDKVIRSRLENMREES